MIPFSRVRNILIDKSQSNTAPPEHIQSFLANDNCRFGFAVTTRRNVGLFRYLKTFLETEATNYNNNFSSISNLTSGDHPRQNVANKEQRQRELPQQVPHSSIIIYGGHWHRRSHQKSGASSNTPHSQLISINGPPAADHFIPISKQTITNHEYVL
jgi:hypothetical protein